MSPERWKDTLISWLHSTAATITFWHVRTTILTESYSNSGLGHTQICAYSISTGSLQWQKSFFTSVISMKRATEADGVLYLATGQALNASTGQVIGNVWGLGTYNFHAPSAMAVGDGRIAVAGDPRVLDLYGLPGS